MLSDVHKAASILILIAVVFMLSGYLLGYLLSSTLVTHIVVFLGSLMLLVAFLALSDPDDDNDE